MVDTPSGFLAPERMVDSDGRLTVEFRTFLQNLGNVADAISLAEAAMALAQQAALKAANLSDLTNDAAARSNLGLSAIAIGVPQGPWDNPVGTGDRGTVDSTWTTNVSSIYTQAEIV